MIDSEAIRKLREMRLDDVVDILEAQQKDTAITIQPFDERLEAVIEYLYSQKYNQKIKGLIARARFRLRADIHDIVYDGRALDRTVVTELSACGYIKNNTNIILQGYAGSGKTHLACALGKEACIHFYSTRYIRLADLLIEYGEARDINTQKVKKVLSKYSKYKVLILDEWLMDELTADDQHFLFELMERRYDIGSTIFCTQYRKENWRNRLGADVHAEAIMDRIVHNAVWIEMGEVNMREYLAKHTVMELPEWT